MRRIVFAALIAAASSSAVAQNAAQSYSQDQERYCTGDAMRLCSHEIPDVGRITACMTYYRDYLSPACKAVFGPAPTNMQASRAKQQPRKPQ